MLDLSKLLELKDSFIQELKRLHEQEPYNTDVEGIITDLLCDLPKDIIYLEWWARTDIIQWVDGINTNEKLDRFMNELWEMNYGFMDGESISYEFEQIADKINKGE